MNIEKKFVHLFFISSDWENYHRKVFTQTIQSSFKKWSDVYLIQYPVSLTVNLFIKFRKRFLGFITGKYKLRETEDGIKIFTPFVLFHINLWNRIGFLKFIDIFILSFIIKNLLKKLNDKIIILWVYLPEHLLIIKKLRYNFLIYDFYDNQAYSTDGILIKEKDLLNNELIKKSDLVICTGRVLYENAVRQNINSIHLPNANNAGSKIVNSKSDIVTELTGMTGPIIGYVGNVRDWIDFELIKYLLEEYREAKIVFVGPVDKTAVKCIRKLSHYTNLIITGNKPVELIPHYLKSFKVGIIPFKLNKFTEGVMPYKFFEYLNAGIPIVTTYLPDFKFYESHIGYSKNYNQFLENCKSAINGGFENKVKNYENLARENSWEKRVEVLSNIFKEKFKIDN